MTTEIKPCMLQSVDSGGRITCNYLDALGRSDPRYASVIAKTINPNREVMLCNQGSLGAVCRDGIEGAAYFAARRGFVSNPDQIIPIKSIPQFQRSE